MTLNLYVMPITGGGTNPRTDPREPKYVSTFQTYWNTPGAAEMKDYGNEPQCIVGILNVDSATDSALNAFGDVIGITTNLGSQVGGARSTVQNKLEAVNIPGTWVQTTNTWRDVVLFVMAAIQFAQAFQGQANGRWFAGSVTLDTTFGSLSANVRSQLQQAVLQLNSLNGITLDTSSVTGSSTLRQIIQAVAQQLVGFNVPLTIAGLSLYTV